MKAGALDRRITIERYTSVQNEYGEPVVTWANLATVWASWRRASARETLAALEIAAAVSDVFEVRYSGTVSAITPKDRLVYGERNFDIVSVEEIGRREGLRINAIARAE